MFEGPVAVTGTATKAKADVVTGVLPTVVTTPFKVTVVPAGTRTDCPLISVCCCPAISTVGVVVEADTRMVRDTESVVATGVVESVT
jgi:hypothetical protein